MSDSIDSGHSDPSRAAPSPVGQPDVFERLVAALQSAHVPFHHMHHEAVFTSVQAAQVRDTPLHSGAKALILKGAKSFLMAVMPADMALAGNVFRRHIGVKRLRFATKDEVLAITGLTPGSIPPFGSLFELPTYCDKRLAENAEINFNAGRHTDSLCLAYDDYVAYERPDLGDFAKPASEEGA